MAEEKPSLLQRFATPEPAPPWTLTTVLFTLLAAVAAMIAASGFAAAWIGDAPIALLVAWTLGGVFIIVFVRQSRRREADRAALRLAPPQTPLILLLLFSLGLAIALDLLSLGVTGQFLPLAELLPLAQQPTLPAWLLAIAFMIIVQPAAEELIFRGVAFPALRAALGGWLGIVICALLSGIFHFIIYTASYGSIYPNVSREVALWYGLILPLLDALIFTLMRAGSGSTRAAIAAHSAFGLFALLKLYTLMG